MRKEPFDFQPDYSRAVRSVKSAGEDAMRAPLQSRQAGTHTRRCRAREAIKAALTEEQQDDEPWFALKKLESAILRGDVVKTGKRIDGRD